MKYLFKGILFIVSLASCENTHKPEAEAVIFDTDIAPDYDEVGALALLHAFADRGEARNKPFATGAKSSLASSVFLYFC